MVHGTLEVMSYVNVFIYLVGLFHFVFKIILYFMREFNC